jgi:hypothetical protein
MSHRAGTLIRPSGAMGTSRLTITLKPQENYGGAFRRLFRGALLCLTLFGRYPEGVAIRFKALLHWVRGSYLDPHAPPSSALLHPLRGSKCGLENLSGPGMVAPAFGQPLQFQERLERLAQLQPKLSALDMQRISDCDSSSFHCLWRLIEYESAPLENRVFNLPLSPPLCPPLCLPLHLAVKPTARRLVSALCKTPRPDESSRRTQLTSNSEEQRWVWRLILRKQ